MENVYFTKLVKDVDGEDAEQKHLLYIKSKWSEMGLELIIYASDTAETFKGELSAGEMRRIADEIETPLEQFYDECKEAITASKILGAGYLYRLDSEMFKLVKKDTFEINLLEVPLKKLSSPLQILDYAFEEITKLRDKKDATVSLTQHEDQTTQETLEILRNCLKEKEQIEKVLLRKFLMLLNTKKEEINKLKAQLEIGAGNGSDLGDDDNQGLERQQHRKSNREEIDDFDADTQPFVDEDMEN